jgi:hypothetical protein
MCGCEEASVNVSTGETQASTPSKMATVESRDVVYDGPVVSVAF